MTKKLHWEEIRAKIWEEGGRGREEGGKGEGGGRKGGGRRERKGEKIGREERRERKNYMKIGQN